MTNSSPDMLRAQPRVVSAAATDVRSVAEAIDEARNRGHAQGYAAGLAEGRAAAAAEAAQQRAELAEHLEQSRKDQAAAVTDAVSGLVSAADALARAASDGVAADLNALLGAAADLAETMVGHDLACRAEPGLDAVRRAVAAAPAPGPLTVRLHPDDAAIVAAQPPRPDFVVIADPAIERGGCIAEQGDSRIDALISNAVQRVREVLS
jgi:flagellar assembly protein FliH